MNKQSPPTFMKEINQWKDAKRELRGCQIISFCPCYQPWGNEFQTWFWKSQSFSSSWFVRVRWKPILWSLDQVCRTELPGSEKGKSRTTPNRGNLNKLALSSDLHQMCANLSGEYFTHLPQGLQILDLWLWEMWRMHKQDLLSSKVLMTNQSSNAPWFTLVNQ